MRDVFERVERVASSNCTVLITGETGTGKELVAQALHHADATRTRPARRRQLRGPARAPAGIASSSATRRGPSPAPTAASRAASSWPRAGPSSSTRSASCRWGCRPSCSGSSRTAPSSGSAAAETAPGRRPGPGRDEPRPGRGRRRGPVPRGPLLTGSTSSRSTCRRSASGPRTSRCWSTTSSSGSASGATPRRTFARETLARLARYDWPGNVRELEHLVEQLVITAPGPTRSEPENLPPLHRLRPGEEPFGPRLRPRPPAPGDHRRADRADRAAYLRRVLETLPRPDRPLRRALRPLASEHQREAPPLPDRQGRRSSPTSRARRELAVGD